MNKIDSFIKTRADQTVQAWKAMNEKGFKIEIFDMHEIFDLYFVYKAFPKQATWKEVFDFVTMYTTDDLSNQKNCDKYKQRANRYFNCAIRSGYAIKVQNPEDKRSVLFTWTPKFIELVKVLKDI